MLLRIGQHEFEVEEETEYVTVPKEFLTGFRLGKSAESGINAQYSESSWARVRRPQLASLRHGT